jgi:hypothetical protein
MYVSKQTACTRSLQDGGTRYYLVLDVSTTGIYIVYIQNSNYTHNIFIILWNRQFWRLEFSKANEHPPREIMDCVLPFCVR